MQSFKILLILILPTAVFGQEVIPYPDNSPFVKDYVKMGVPDPSVIWEIEKYRSAFSILDQIYEVDKFSLPRLESDYSGPLFDRMVSIENFDFLTQVDQNIGRRVLAFEHLKEVPFRLLIYYIEDHELEERFGKEVLECLFLDAYLYHLGLELYAELEIQLGVRAQQGSFQVGKERLLLEFNGKIDQIMNVFENGYHRFETQDLVTFANKLYFFLPKISNPTYRKQLKFRLKTLNNGAFSPGLVQILKEMKQQL